MLTFILFADIFILNLILRMFFNRQLQFFPDIRITSLFRISDRKGIL